MVHTIGQYGFEAGKRYQQNSDKSVTIQYSEQARGSSKDLFSYLLVFDQDNNARYSDTEIKAATGLSTNLDLSKIWDTDKSGDVDIKEAYMGLSHLEQADNTQNATITQEGRNVVNALSQTDYETAMRSTRNTQQQEALDGWFKDYLNQLVQASNSTEKTETEQDIITRYLALDLSQSAPTGNDFEMIENNETHIQNGQYTEAGIRELVDYAENDIAGLEENLKNKNSEALTEDGLITKEELSAFYQLEHGLSEQEANEKAENFVKAFDHDNSGGIDATEHASSLALEDNPGVINSRKAEKLVSRDTDDTEAVELDLSDFSDILGDIGIDPNDTTNIDTDGDGVISLADIPGYPSDQEAFVTDGKSTTNSRLFLDTALIENNGRVKRAANDFYEQFKAVVGH